MIALSRLLKGGGNNEEGVMGGNQLPDSFGGLSGIKDSLSARQGGNGFAVLTGPLWTKGFNYFAHWRQRRNFRACARFALIPSNFFF